jgi:hypothetical protein
MMKRESPDERDQRGKSGRPIGREWAREKPQMDERRKEHRSVRSVERRSERRVVE